MAKTLADVKTEVLYRLGDSASDIWSESEVARYLNEGYERLANTGLLWDAIYLEDQDYAGNYTAIWEAEYLEPGMVLLNQFHYTYNWEADYAFGDGLFLGPANHAQFWEYDNSYVATSYFVAVHQMPDEAIQIERATWNKRRIEPLYSQELSYTDGQYQAQQGEVMGYIQDKDGLRSFRKWRIPASTADEYTVTGTTGLLRDCDDISTEEVIGSWGCARRIPGEHPCSGDGPRGIPRRVWKAAKNTKIEYRKTGATLVEDTDEFELPDIYVKYIRFFALYRCYDREGTGQDLQLAAFWKGRWQAGEARAKKRQQAVLKTRIHVLGGQETYRGRPPLARLPWAYGRVVR